MKGRDFALLTDLYELTMMQGYYETGAYNRKVVFDLFYRKNPSGNGFAITAGLQQAIEYLDGLHFTEEDIASLLQGFQQRFRCFTRRSEVVDILRLNRIHPSAVLYIHKVDDV